MNKPLLINGLMVYKNALEPLKIVSAEIISKCYAKTLLQ